MPTSGWHGTTDSPPCAPTWRRCPATGPARSPGTRRQPDGRRASRSGGTSSRVPAGCATLDSLPAETAALPTLPQSRSLRRRQERPLAWRLELVAVPVSDVDRAKAFYTEKAGFNADHDHQVSDELRFVQLTPLGSPTSISLGTGLTDMLPGSLQGLQMVVSDIESAHAELVERGVDVSEVQHFPWGSFVFFSDPDGTGWAVQKIPTRD